MRLVANIPSNVTYFWSNQIEVGFSWDGDDDNTVSNEVDVLPSFCSDSDNAKTLVSGEEWAKRYSVWDNTTKSYVCSPVHKISRDNKPISGVRIVSLERRSQGGRAYKVVTKDGHYFDLREDVLLDIISNASISNSVISCDLLWCKIGAEMKLIRVDSDLHKHAIESTAVKKAGPIPASQLVAGKIYEMRNGDKVLFLGNCMVDLDDSSNRTITYKSAKQQLWYEIPNYKMSDIGDKKAFFDTFLHGGNGNSSMCSYYYNFCKAKTVYVETNLVPDFGFDDIEAHCMQYNSTSINKYKSGSIKIL